MPSTVPSLPYLKADFPTRQNGPAALAGKIRKVFEESHWFAVSMHDNSIASYSESRLRLFGKSVWRSQQRAVTPVTPKKCAWCNTVRPSQITLPPEQGRRVPSPKDSAVFAKFSPLLLGAFLSASLRSGRILVKYFMQLTTKTRQMVPDSTKPLSLGFSNEISGASPGGKSAPMTSMKLFAPSL